MREGSKYHSLYQHLRASGQDEVQLTFGELEALIGALPASARKDRAWWGNRRTGAGQATAWMEAGYHVVDLDLAAERVTFRQPTHVYTVRRVGDAILWDSEAIKALRSHMDRSQTQLAEELSVRQQTISEWETGMYQPTRAMSKLLLLIAERAGFTYQKPPQVDTVQGVGRTMAWDSDFIKALRSHMAMSQTQMADELGVRQQTISEWETGVYQPTRAMSKLLTLVAERAGFTYGADEQQ